MSFYHDGNIAFQKQFDGIRLAKPLEDVRVHSTFWPDEIEQINHAPFFFLATTHGNMVDCSYKGGEPGFVNVTGPDTLEWPDYDGNSMYRSLGNLNKNPNVGLLFVPFDSVSPRLRINGIASLIVDRKRVAAYAGAKLIVSVKCSFIYKNGSFENGVGNGLQRACELNAEKSSLPAMRNRTVRMVSKRAYPRALRLAA